jgi:hypothetical protein
VTAVAVILAVYTIALGIWAAWHIRQLWQAATRIITPADLETLIDAEREYHGLPPICSDPACIDADLEALARDAARRSGCPLCRVEDEATQ